MLLTAATRLAELKEDRRRLLGGGGSVPAAPDEGGDLGLEEGEMTEVELPPLPQSLSRRPPFRAEEEETLTPGKLT